MKKFHIFLIIILAMIMLNIAPSADVNAQMFSSYVSGLTVQNLSEDPADITIEFYQSESAGLTSTTEKIAGLEVVDYASLPSSFKGSVVIKSTQPLGAVSTLNGANRGRGMYTGSTGGSTSVVLPFMMHNWGVSSWSTYFSIQNVGSSATTVNIDYASCPALIDKTISIEANKMVIVNQADEACMAGKVMTSAKITSVDQPVAVVVSQESDVVKSALVSNGYSVGSTNPVIPLVNSNNPDVKGWRTAIAMFNLGNVSSNVTLQYVRKDGFKCEETRTISPNSATEFGGNAFIVGSPALTCPKGERFIGAAYVKTNTGNVDLVATVNQDRGTLASSYSSFNMNDGTPKIAFPRFVNQFGGIEAWDSTFTVMNVGTSNVYVKCTYTGVNYYTSQLGLIAPKGVKEDLPHHKLEANYSGGAVCTSYSDAAYTNIDTTAKIVGIVNTRGFGGPSYNDLMMTYEAVNIQ